MTAEPRSEDARRLAAAPNLLAPILEWAERRPERPAQRFFAEGAWRERSWGELGERVHRIARGLAGAGVRPGDRVGIVCSTRPEWALADLGALAAGAVVVSVYPTLPPADTAHPIAHGGVVAVFVEDAEQAAKIAQMRHQLPALRVLVALTEPTPEGCRPLAELEAAGGGDGRLPGLAATRGTPLAIMYTSGTTGVPKGAVLGHGNVLAVLAAALEAVPHTRRLEVNLSFLPLAHALERLGGHFLPLVLGRTVAYARGLDTIADDFRAVRPDFAIAVPRVFEKVHGRIMARAAASPPLRRRLFDWALRQGLERSRLAESSRPVPPALGLRHAVADLLVLRRLRGALGGRLRLLISGGAPLDGDIARFFHAAGILVLEGWGATETSAPATLNTPEAFRFGSVGRPLPGVEVRLADDGELEVRGPSVFAGYWRDPEATAEVLGEDGWYATGDIGRFDDDGFVWITDRKKEIIVTAGGKNIAPQRIERLLRARPGIANCMAWGDRRPYLVALLTLDREGLAAVEPALAGTAPDHPALVAHLRAQVDAVNAELARFEQVKAFRVVEPDFTVEGGELTVTQKLKRRVVAAKHAAALAALYEPDA